MATDSLDGVATACTWYGRNIEELTKEELLDVVRHLGHDLAEERKSHMATLEIWELSRKAVRV